MNTKERYLGRLNQVLSYIETHLNETLTLDDLAKISCFSRFHFHRIFTAFMGESVYSYIRRLRIERATLKLSKKNKTMTNIALQSGYETSAAFSKAFKQVMGMTPSQYQISNFHQSTTNFLEEKQLMQPTIKILPDQHVLLIRKIGAYEQSAPQAWKELLEFAALKKIPYDDDHLIGIVHDDDRITDEEKLRFDACVIAPPHFKAEGKVGVQTIQGGRYAVFQHQGSHQTIHHTYRQIYAEWYPESKVTLRDLPCFSKRLNSSVLPHNIKELITEIYIPIQ